MALFMYSGHHEKFVTAEDCPFIRFRSHQRRSCFPWSVSGRLQSERAVDGDSMIAGQL